MLRNPLHLPRGPERRYRPGISGILDAGRAGLPVGDPRFSTGRRRQVDRAAKRILVLADDHADGENFASDLCREGYAAPTADFDHLPHLRMSPMPRLVAICSSPRLERVLDLCRRLSELQGVAVLVVGTPGLFQLEGALQLPPTVRAILFRPYSRARLLEALESALTAPVPGFIESA